MASRLTPQLKPLRQNVGRIAALDHANIRSRLGVDPPQRHRGQRLRGHHDRIDAPLWRHASVRGTADHSRTNAILRWRGDRDSTEVAARVERYSRTRLELAGI